MAAKKTQTSTEIAQLRTRVEALEGFVFSLQTFIAQAYMMRPDVQDQIRRELEARK